MLFNPSAEYSLAGIMLKAGKYYLKYLALFSVFSAFIFFTSCENSIKEISSIPDMVNLPVQLSKNIEIIYSDSAEVKIRITAPLLQRYDEPEKQFTEFPAGIYVVFYNSDQTMQSSLKADHAIYHERVDSWEASNNVVVVTKNHDRINTEKLIWDRKAGIIYSNEFVKITTRDEIIYGNGFEADQSLDNYVIKKITGTINLKE